MNTKTLRERAIEWLEIIQDETRGLPKMLERRGVPGRFKWSDVRLWIEVSPCCGAHLRLRHDFPGEETAWLCDQCGTLSFLIDVSAGLEQAVVTIAPEPKAPSTSPRHLSESWMNPLEAAAAAEPEDGSGSSLRA